jgi:hypothetical protein
MSQPHRIPAETPIMLSAAVVSAALDLLAQLPTGQAADTFIAMRTAMADAAGKLRTVVNRVAENVASNGNGKTP